MKRRFRMVARGYLPAVAVVMLAMLAQLTLDGLGTSAVAGVSAVQTILLLGFFLGMAMLGWTTYRLVRWNSGHAPSCSVCAGMLGRKRVHQGKPYRRCLACAKDNARRRYAYAGSDGHFH